MQNLRDVRAELIQKKTEHYIPIFNSLEQGKTAAWNWCGFLVGPLWFAYRKMYAAAAVAFAVIYFGGVAISMLAVATGNPEVSYIGKTFNFAWAAVQGGMANRVYWWHITRLANRDDADEGFIKRKGGVSKAAVVWAIIIILAVDITGIWI